MITDLIRPRLHHFKPYSSARSEMTEGKIFLDANELSLGSPISLEDVVLNRYPDPLQIKLRKALERYTGIPIEQIFVGVGSDEVLDLLLRLFCEPNQDAVGVLVPTYGVYHVFAELNGIQVHPVELDPLFQIDVTQTLHALPSNTKIIFCCSPNNPTGNLLHPEQILDLCTRFHGLVVVDEAYVEFAERPSLALEVAAHENLIVTRTLSKAWGMAGIRLGYCIAHTEVVSYLMRIKAPYNINAITSAVALKALDHTDFMEQAVVIIRSERARLASRLERIPSVKKVYPSDANFLLVEFDEPQIPYQTLLKEGIVVRQRSEKRLQSCLRLTVGSKDENNAILALLEQKN